MTKQQVIDDIHMLQDQIGMFHIAEYKASDVIQCLGHIAQEVAKINEL